MGFSKVWKVPKIVHQVIFVHMAIFSENPNKFNQSLKIKH